MLLKCWNLFNMLKANLTVKDVLPSLGRKLPRVFDDVRLDEMLHEFKRGQSHLALVPWCLDYLV